LSESKDVGNWKKSLPIVVGILAVISVFLQTLSSELNYQGKAETHEAVCLDLRRLLDQLDVDGLLIRGDEEEDKDRDAEKEKQYEARTTQTLNGCKYVLPLRIATAFALVSSRFSTSDAYRKLARKKDTRWPTIFTIVYDEIFTAFEERWRFPWLLPPAEKVVGIAMKQLTYDRLIGKKMEKPPKS
jgi:hypothetical protein